MSLHAYNPQTRQWEEFRDFPQTYHEDGDYWYMANGFVYWGGRWVHAWRTIDIFVTIPTVRGTYTYTRNSSGAVSQTVQWYNYDTTLMEIVTAQSTTTASAAGTYNVVFKLKDRHSAWSDGTTGNKTVSWTIAKRSVTQPNVYGSYTFSKSNASTITTFTVSNGSGYSMDTNYVDFVSTGSTTSAQHNGSYPLNFKLKDTASCVWSGTSPASTANITKYWTISKRTLKTPAQDYIPEYTGSALPANSNWNTIFNNDWDSYQNYITISASTQTNAGTYSASFSMRSDCRSDCNWQNGTSSSEATTAQWKISKKVVSAPTWGQVTYNGSSHYARDVMSGFNSNYMSCSNSATDACPTNVYGDYQDYTATVTISNNNYSFSGGSTSASVSWRIARKSVTVSGGGSFKVYPNNVSPISVSITFNQDVGTYTRADDDSANAYSWNGYVKWQFGYIQSSGGTSPYATITLTITTALTTSEDPTDARCGSPTVYTNLTTRNYDLNDSASGIRVGRLTNVYGDQVWVLFCDITKSW